MENKAPLWNVEYYVHAWFNGNPEMFIFHDWQSALININYIESAREYELIAVYRRSGVIGTEKIDKVTREIVTTVSEWPESA